MLRWIWQGQGSHQYQMLQLPQQSIPNTVALQWRFTSFHTDQNASFSVPLTIPEQMWDTSLSVLGVKEYMGQAEI